MRYSDVESFVQAGLVARNYDPAALPVFDPGPSNDVALLKRTPGPMAFLLVGNGIGTEAEETYDRLFIVVRAVGPQMDYATAESLAWDIDTVMLGAQGNTIVGTARTLGIYRAAGAPVLVAHDAADRYHFQCTYVTSTQTGL